MPRNSKPVTFDNAYQQSDKRWIMVNVGRHRSVSTDYWEAWKIQPDGQVCAYSGYPVMIGRIGTLKTDVQTKHVTTKKDREAVASICRRLNKSMDHLDAQYQTLKALQSL